MTVREMEAACNGPKPLEIPEHELKGPELSLSKTFYPLGFPLEVRTNSAMILEMYERLWSQFTHVHDAAPMRSEVYVTEGGSGARPPAPSYQYLEPLFVCVADPQHYCIVDMAAGRTIASIAEASLKHRLYVEQFFLMPPLSTIPAKPIHAACVAWNGCGVLLCGDSGAGKSTLAYACARSGWEYVSDDASFVLECDLPCVTGNWNLVRFRPSAAELFPELEGLEETPRVAGKPSIELSTRVLPQIVPRPKVPVKFIIFLDRSSSDGAELVPYREDVARMYMRQGMYATPSVRARHFAAIERMLASDVFQLRYGPLECAIERLRRLVEEGL